MSNTSEPKEELTEEMYEWALDRVRHWKEKYLSLFLAQYGGSKEAYAKDIIKQYTSKLEAIKRIRDDDVVSGLKEAKELVDLHWDK